MTEPTKEDAVGRKEPSGGNAEGNASLGSSGGLMEKLNILEGDGWMEDYTAKMVSPVEYAVLSLNNGQPSQHFVNLRDRSCTCEDKKYNVERAAGMCTHQLYCMLREDAPEERDTALLAVVAWASERMANLSDRVAEAADRIVRAATGHQADRAADAAASGGSAGPTPEEAQASLREAVESNADFNLKDITTGEYEGDEQVWFKMGAEDFDDLKRVTSECDLVGYNGEWNTVNVENVTEYIEDVLG